MKRQKRDTEPTAYRVEWTNPPPRYFDRLRSIPQRPAAFLVYGSPTRTKEEHLRSLWAEWITDNPPPEIPATESPTSPENNNRYYTLRQRRGETHTQLERRKNERAAKLARGEHKRNRLNPAALPPHRFTRWTHPPCDCGPVYPHGHPLESRNSLHAWGRVTEAPEPAKPGRGRPTRSTLPKGTPPRFRSRFSFRIPAALIPGCPPHVAHVPPLSIVCDPDPAEGITAEAAALSRWVRHAAPHYALAEIETGTASPMRSRLPRGTVKTYAGTAGDPLSPLSMATVPPPLPDPYAIAAPMPAPRLGELPGHEEAPRSGKERGEILRGETPRHSPAPRVNTEAPIYLAYEDEQAPRDRRTIEHREYVQRVADAIEAGAYDPEDPWKRTPSPNR